MPIKMKNTVHIKATHAPLNSDSISAADLHEVLEPAQTVLRTFESEKKLVGYRRMLYDINRQGTYRYRTLRDEEHMWGLVIWRMK